MPATRSSYHHRLLRSPCKPLTGPSWLPPCVHPECRGPVSSPSPISTGRFLPRFGRTSGLPGPQMCHIRGDRWACLMLLLQVRTVFPRGWPVNCGFNRQLKFHSLLKTPPLQPRTNSSHKQLKEPCSFSVQHLLYTLGTGKYLLNKRVNEGKDNFPLRTSIP